MNIPNLLTMIRFVLIPVYAAVFGSGHVKAAFGILLIAGLTDVLDGYIARSRGLVTELGSMLDPLADKLMLITVFLSFLFSGMIPWTAACAMFVRDAGMIAGSVYFHLQGKKTIPADAMGKLTTVLTYIVILCIVFEVPYALYALWTVVGFSFLTTFLYIIKFRKLNPDAFKRKRAHF